MHAILSLDIFTMVKTVGYVGLFAMVFLESGVFFGFFLPGGSLLFTAGLLASQGFFNIYILAVILAVAAILGDNVGYWFGYKMGAKIFTKEDSLFFHKKHVQRTQDFYAKYGAMAIVIGRFVPIVRTFAPILAGVGKMNYSRFLGYNILGALLWAVGMTFLGYFLGASVPNAESFILPIVIVIIVLSIIPIIYGVWSSKK